MFVDINTSNLRLDNIVLDLTSKYKITATQYSYRPSGYLTRVIQDDEYESSITKWVDDIKNFIIVECDLLPYTRSFFKEKNLRIETITLSGFTREENDLQISATITGFADHNALPMEGNKILPFKMTRHLSKNGVYLITSFIKNNLGDLKWQ